MDELASAAAKLAGQLRGKRWYRGVELGTAPDGKPALHMKYRGPLAFDGLADGPIGFIDDFPVYLIAEKPGLSEFIDLAGRCEV